MNKTTQVSIQLAAAALLLGTLACSVAPPSSQDELATLFAATLQALTQQAAALPSPTSAPPPTITLIPSAAPPPTIAPPIPTTSNLPPATRINFAAGGTQGVVQSSIQAAQTSYFVLRAFKGQPMIVQLDSPDQSVSLSIFGANGAILLAAAPPQNSWQGLLPASQDYYLRVSGGNNAQNFTLNVVIASRIQFAAGQNKITLNGQTLGGYAIAYVANALAGQKMDVSINTAANVAALTIWGFTDGQPYARAQNGVVDFSLTLPSTQDYIIEAVPQGGQVVNFKLTVKIQ